MWVLRDRCWLVSAQLRGRWVMFTGPAHLLLPLLLLVSLVSHPVRF